MDDIDKLLDEALGEETVSISGAVSSEEEDDDRFWREGFGTPVKEVRSGKPRPAMRQFPISKTEKTYTTSGGNTIKVRGDIEVNLDNPLVRGLVEHAIHWGWDYYIEGRNFVYVGKCSDRGIPIARIFFFAFMNDYVGKVRINNMHIDEKDDNITIVMDISTAGDRRL